jgi:hypothetical protein
MALPWEDKEETFVPAVSSFTKDSRTCYYCHLRHEKVEASGVYHCPNPLCSGPGGGYFRSKLKSYTEVENDRHTVDHEEWLNAAVEYMLKENIDDILKEKIMIYAVEFYKQLGQTTSSFPLLTLIKRMKES